MKKKCILLLISILLVLISTGCFNEGITQDVQININNTNTHEEKDIDDVIKKLKNEFVSFQNCRLLTIDYDSVNQNMEEEWNNIKYNDIMVIKFSFICEGNSNTFSKNETYYYTAYYGKISENSSYNLITMGQG